MCAPASGVPLGRREIGPGTPDEKTSSRTRFSVWSGRVQSLGQPSLFGDRSRTTANAIRPDWARMGDAIVCRTRTRIRLCPRSQWPNGTLLACGSRLWAESEVPMCAPASGVPLGRREIGPGTPGEKTSSRTRFSVWSERVQSLGNRVCSVTGVALPRMPFDPIGHAWGTRSFAERVSGFAFATRSQWPNGTLLACGSRLWAESEVPMCAPASGVPLGRREIGPGTPGEKTSSRTRFSVWSGRVQSLGQPSLFGDRSRTTANAIRPDWARMGDAIVCRTRTRIRLCTPFPVA